MRLALFAALIVLAVGALVAAERIATARATAAVGAQVEASARLLAASFRRELDKFMLVPVVLADDREARDALVTRDPGRLQNLNRKLEALSAATNAANVYLLDTRGMTVATSNWRRPDTFLGYTYAFRGYFRDAMRTGRAQQFALGRQSRRPGLYISRLLTDRGRPLGVFVVKVEFGALEREWRETVGQGFVTDGRGIILVSSVPDWQFQTTRPLSAAERARARAALEYGEVPLAENRLFATGAVAPAGGGRATPYLEATEAVGAGWRIHVLAPTGEALSAARTFARLGVAILAMAIGALVLLWRYRQRRERQRIERAAAARLSDMRDQLIQANKLATLGQITAGVAHEINQPLAAIATYAANARMLAARGDHADAGEAMARVGGLTERIGLITRELRGFARRSDGEAEAVSVAEALAGTELLLRDRLRSLGARFTTEGDDVFVRAERVRLEQVLVNLVQNAIDAGARTVAATVAATDARVAITIADDGSGLSDAMRGLLFQPFKTSKKDGLGLGLVICRDIVADFGGSLKAARPERGAAFVIDLERA